MKSAGGSTGRQRRSASLEGKTWETMWNTVAQEKYILYIEWRRSENETERIKGVGAR